MWSINETCLFAKNWFRKCLLSPLSFSQCLQSSYKQLHKAGCVVLSVSNQSMSEDEDFSNCVHCNMPKDHAMDFVMAEYGRGLGQRMQQKDPAETGARAAELVDDYLEREKVEKHAVPSDTRQLHFFLADGVHLYPEELSTIAKYLHNCQHHLQAMSTETGDGPLPERTKMLPPGLGKPPPLLPTPSGPRGRETPPWRREHSATPLMTSPGGLPNTPRC
uniref:Si:ch211-216l23.2 n=1 Tax=Salmo trutta TaxID=8032 RepID=A0A673YR83_SALTR